MKKVGLFIAVFLLALLLRANAEQAQYIDIQVTRTVSATECYVVLTLDASALTAAEAMKAAEQKLRSFSEEAAKTFSGLEIKEIPTGVTMQGGESNSSSPKAATPLIAKILICTLPPEETLAVKLLDLGIKNGLTPFFGHYGQYGYTCGAIFYGVRNPETLLKELRHTGLRKLNLEAEKLTAMGNALPTELTLTFSSFEGFPGELTFRETKFSLPAEFCGFDKDNIKISLFLSADFKPVPRNGNK